jgi:uncharacterized protein (TIGR03083 family)
VSERRQDGETARRLGARRGDARVARPSDDIVDAANSTAAEQSPITPSPHHPITPGGALDVRPLLPGERAALLDLLAKLTPAQWAAATICPGWSVKDIALHLLGDDVGVLSRLRDGFVHPAFGEGLDVSTLPGLIAAIDRQNAVWVEGVRRISPRLLIELLELTGRLSAEYYASLDLLALGSPVDWAGPAPAPVWLDIAREYTERWVHQQHIRDAVGVPGLKERQWLAPVLKTFVRGLPRALSDAPAPDGATLHLIVTGEAGGAWLARRHGQAWILDAVSEPAAEATATVALDQDIAWRLFTKGIAKEEAKRAARIEGDSLLADRVFDTVSILA